MDDCNDENGYQNVGDTCKFCISREKVGPENCQECKINLKLSIRGCGCEQFKSDYNAKFFIRGNTGQSNLTYNRCHI